jgi:hypothetical protein
MAFGRRNNRGSDADVSTETEGAEGTSANSVAPDETDQPKQKKRKPAELLSSVVNESAVGAAIDLLKQNEAFALPNGTAWVGLLLSVDEIGGLSQKQKGDATKGSIIELIAADRIQVIATKDMLDEEFLGIIPTAETLSRMDEYSLLTEAHYNWTVFRSEDAGQSLVADVVDNVPATHATALEISRGDLNLSALLPEVWAWGGGAIDSTETVEAPAAAELAIVGASFPASSSSSTASVPAADNDALGDASGDGDTDDSAAPAASDIEPEFDTAAFEAEFDGADPAIAGAEEDGSDDLASEPLSDSRDESVDRNKDEVADDEEPDADASAIDDASAGYYQYVDANRSRVVDEREVRETIARRFLSTDLDLVVDLAEFDRTFATEAASISIEIAENPADWLGSQVAQLSRQANAELARLHQGNTDELREMFVETMALHVEKTMAVVSTEAPGSQYSALMAGARKDFEAQRSTAPQEVSAQRKEITAQFDAAAASRAAQAAAHARIVYEDKNRPKLERDLAGVALDLDRQHEEQYAHDRQTVLEMRRKDANVRMDIGTNRVFELLRERQAAQREDERELLEHWNRELTRFIDENRKNDVSRATALAEELARDNQIEALKAEHAARLEELRTEHANREDRLDQELIRNREEALLKLNTRQSEWTSSLALEQQRVTSTSELAEQLGAQLKNLTASYEEVYQGRLSTLEADKASFAQELDRASEIHKRSNSVMIVLVVTIAIAALAVGIIAGWAWGSAQSAPAGFVVVGSFLTGPTGWSGF